MTCLLLLVPAAAMAVFAAQNPDPLTVRYPGGDYDTTLPVLAVAAYLLGAVFGILRRSLAEATG